MRYSHLIVLCIFILVLGSQFLYGQDSAKVKEFNKELERISEKYKSNETASSFKSRDVDSRPSEFMLYQNFPNPFNPTTIITYQIKESDFVQLKVYDVLCHEVALLVEKVQPAGYYQVTFDGNNLSDGVYFYRLQTGNYVDVKKMVLVK